MSYSIYIYVSFWVFLKLLFFSFISDLFCGMLNGYRRGRDSDSELQHVRTNISCTDCFCNQICVPRTNISCTDRLFLQSDLCAKTYKTTCVVSVSQFQVE